MNLSKKRPSSLPVSPRESPACHYTWERMGGFRSSRCSEPEARHDPDPAASADSFKVFESFPSIKSSDGSPARSAPFRTGRLPGQLLPRGGKDGHKPGAQATGWFECPVACAPGLCVHLSRRGNKHWVGRTGSLARMGSDRTSILPERVQPEANMEQRRNGATRRILGRDLLGWLGGVGGILLLGGLVVLGQAPRPCTSGKQPTFPPLAQIRSQPPPTRGEAAVAETQLSADDSAAESPAGTETEEGPSLPEPEPRPQRGSAEQSAQGEWDSSARRKGRPGSDHRGACSSDGGPASRRAATVRWRSPPREAACRDGTG